MGTLRGDNGGGERPQEGGGLPDLPPEWGTIIIPDDAGALDHEGASIRRQFRRAAMRRRWRRRLHLRPEPLRRTTDDSPGLAVPLLIMSIAVIATLVSLFAVAWPGRAPKTTPRVGSPTTPAVAVSLAGVSLQDPDGAPVALKDLTPAVILLVEGCTCEKLISSTTEAVAGSASTAKVLVVAVHAPTLPSGLNEKVTVRALADPNNSVRATVPALAGDRTSSAVLVDADGRVIRATRSVTSPDEFRADLSKL
ncbi:TlpA family protein disulfide reductase [Dactylosporangium sp. NPDC048998]|uniref:TlpA family protein disulfide reductase n=1 Tax=Dactylosporangium sp. NPDC048998 TaxID=3363976 RepID=UPI00371DB922